MRGKSDGTRESADRRHSRGTGAQYDDGIQCDSREDQKISDETVKRVQALLEEKKYIPNMAGIHAHSVCCI